MLAHINDIMLDKVKSYQQQLRARDERIVTLETENAMLYLKLAQCQSQLQHSKQEAMYQQDINEEEERFRYTLKENLFIAQEQIEMLKEQLKTLRKDFEAIPMYFKQCLSNNVLEQSGIQKLLRSFGTEQNMNTELLKMQLHETEMARDEAVRKNNEERNRRRALHNALIELKGNIRVHCRVRPMLAALDSNGDDAMLGIPMTQAERIVEVLDEETLTFNQLNNGGANRAKKFEYERVYQSSDNQKTVFNDVAPLLTSLLDGYNVCIMAYGQTGSGKTHTMVGDHSLDDDLPLNSNEEFKEGIIPRSAKEILRLIRERESTTERYSLDISIFEVYNNEIVDLLATGQAARNQKHAVFSASDGSQEIPSLTAKTVTTAREVIEYVKYGMRHRHEDSTKVHSHSSRSHLIVQLNIYQTNHSNSTNNNLVADPGSSKKPVQSSSIPVRSRSPAPSNTRYMKQYSHPRKSNTGRSLTPTPAQRKSSPPDVTPKINLSVKTKLQLVDLAGSECVGMSGVTGSALRETSNINKSLSALADVLQALSENQNHIPYRNTKLTHILQDTIGGDSKLLVMLCVSPVQKYTTETLQCLGFGSRTRQVARGPAKKRRPTGINLDVSVWSSTESLSPRTSSTSLTRTSSLRR